MHLLFAPSSAAMTLCQYRLIFVLRVLDTGIWCLDPLSPDDFRHIFYKDTLQYTRHGSTHSPFNSNGIYQRKW